jgi:hypothetical protein
MKSIILSSILLLAVCTAKAQVNSLIPNYRTTNAKAAPSQEHRTIISKTDKKAVLTDIVKNKGQLSDSMRADLLTKLSNNKDQKNDSAKKRIANSILSYDGGNEPSKDSLIQYILNVEDEESDSAVSLADGLPLIRIGGLGSISNAANGIDIDPAANINIEFSIPGKKNTGLYRNIRMYLSYNIGSAQDSSEVDSIKLSSFFFPDKSKNGFAAGLTCDIARLIPGIRKYSMQNVGVLEDNKKYTFYTLEPYVEYAYLVRNVKDLKSEVPRIESSTWLLGMKASLQYLVDDNNFAVLFNAYKKWIAFSDNTYPTYNAVFQKTNGDQVMPKNNSLWGLNIGVQLNKAILGFTYESLSTKGIVNKDIAGGTFILKATVSADFLDFK